MRAGGVTILLGLTAIVSYSLGRRDEPANRQTIGAPVTSLALQASPPAVARTSLLAKPEDAAAAADRPQPAPSPPSSPSAVEKAKAAAPQPDGKRKAEVVLTAAAIAAILIRASREQYYRTGHPCACPDDLMRNGRACGGRSAYSRPGGAAPLCYPSDVTPAMIDEYRKTAAR